VKQLGPALLFALGGMLGCGCSTTSSGDAEADEGADKVKVDQTDAVTIGGIGQAVLSLHKRLAYPDACKFGLTLTNNLPYEIGNLSFRFSAFNKADVLHQEVARNFIEIDPAESQYREIEFSGITCDGIRDIEVADPGRCRMGDLMRTSSRPGDCIRHVYIAKTPYVRLVQKRQP
jgi:hypothetical protein